MPPAPFESQGTAESNDHPTVLNNWRFIGGFVSTLLFLFALVGYTAWGIADFYLISDQTQFLAVLIMSRVLAVLATFWMFIAIIGHEYTSRTVNIGFLVLTAILTIPASIFILSFFL